jgi:hypothetical protein
MNVERDISRQSNVIVCVGDNYFNLLSNPLFNKKIEFKRNQTKCDVN